MSFCKFLIYIYCIVFLLIFFNHSAYSQLISISGKVMHNNSPKEFAKISLQNNRYVTITDSLGRFKIQCETMSTFEINVSMIGFADIIKKVSLKEAKSLEIEFKLMPVEKILDEVVVSGTMKEVSKLKSPVPVEVYSAKFFRANPVPSMFEALQGINGIRPQLNCNICSTGDIHINGLEGPYTMILIDGMPIVSGLSTVYGLNGIPQSLIERVEVVKGPASALYGSEAVGGLINIITKSPKNAPNISIDVSETSWAEMNVDATCKISPLKNVQSLFGANFYKYSLSFDKNNDGFTDVTLQNRISVFNKWNFQQKDNRIFMLAGRYVYEDRWGGEMDWTKKFRGGDSIYGESIYTKRWEFFSTYQLPVKEKMIFQCSANGHHQNSFYGTTSFNADQFVGFGQLTWYKNINNQELLLGAAFRYTNYDDNTPATSIYDVSNKMINNPSKGFLPGFILQDEIMLNGNNIVLLGLRYDYHKIHGSIFTPRINYKWNSTNFRNIVRLSLGSGYRVANIFTEDHAALTGARKIEFLDELYPETSWNANINYVKKIYLKKRSTLGFDASVFYTYFKNKIIANYELDPNKIIYDNLDGYAISKGISLNIDYVINDNIKVLIGGTLMDLYRKEDELKIEQLFTEHFKGVWSIGYTIQELALNIDYTGSVYSPMKLPLISDLDPRDRNSPWWSLQNIQITKKFGHGIEVYGGIKNLLNWTPNKGNPFIIAGSNDPFDKNVKFDKNGQVINTSQNPYGLTFDPTYVFAPNQGIKGFLGFRFEL